MTPALLMTTVNPVVLVHFSFINTFISSSAAWCSTQSDSDLNYQTWGYCKLGDGSNCYFPFKSYSGGYSNYECIDKESYGGYGWSVLFLFLINCPINLCFSRCATTTYMSGIYNEWKQCSAAEAGIDVGGEGTGTTVTGEECVPMVYSGVSYEGCTSDTYR